MKISRFFLGCLSVLILSNFTFSQEPPRESPELPDHIYIPYKDLEKVLGNKDQGVFLPYKEFQDLWKLAKGQPTHPSKSGPDYLLSSAKFTGEVGEKLARMKLLLTVDLLREDWVTVPIGLSDVGVISVNVLDHGDDAEKPLLRFQNNQYQLLAKGSGRKTVEIEFVRQLITQPGKNVLQLNIPKAAMNSLELTIPGENLAVDVQPMLAASTSPADIGGGTSVSSDIEIVYALFDQCSLLLNTLDAMIKESGGAATLPFVRRARLSAIAALDSLSEIDEFKGNTHLASIREYVDKMVFHADIAAALFSTPQEKESAIVEYLKVSDKCADSMESLQQLIDHLEEQEDSADGNSNATHLQAFLGQSGSVSLSWAPKSQAANDLEPVLISSQNQHLRIGEALLQHEVSFQYEIRRQGMQEFNILVPADYRVVSVQGENLEKWEINDLQGNGKNTPHNRLVVNLFSKAENHYNLKVKMEKFLEEENSTLFLNSIYTEDALRVSGILGLSHSPRRTAELHALNSELVRVETSRLPGNLNKVSGISAYRFNSKNYSASLRTGIVEPRINLQQLWSLQVDKESQKLLGRLDYEIERAGVFSVSMSLPDAWDVETIQPESLIEDFEIQGEGAERHLIVTLRKETKGKFILNAELRKIEANITDPLVVNLPRPDGTNLNRYKGQLLVQVSEALNTETQEARQLKDLSLREAVIAYGKQGQPSKNGFRNVMAYEFSSVEMDEPLGATFLFTVRPAQVSAEFYRNVDIRAGNVSHEAVIRYQVRYAPVDTFYLKYPAALEDIGLQIDGPDLKEKPKIDELPEGQAEPEPEEDDAVEWIYHKIVLQAPRTGNYDLKVSWRQPFQALAEGGDAVAVYPVLAAGKLAGQSGTISVAKASNLAIGNSIQDNLLPADPSSPRDLPYAAHRENAVLAFRCNTPPFVLSLPVVLQKEAEVYTAIINAAIHEQALARDGALNGRSIFLLSTNRGDRLKVTFPAGSRIYGFFINGEEIQVEAADTQDARIVRLPPSAGQVSKIVLETTFGLQKASSKALPAPRLPEGVPVQRTWWRLWVPNDHQLLTYDRNFERPIHNTDLTQIFSQTGSGHSRKVSSFDPRGTLFQFEKQGDAATLKLGLHRKEFLGVLAWVGFLVFGVALMKIGYWDRIKISIVAAVLLGLSHLFQPLFADAMILHAWFPAQAVAIIWVCQFVFWTAPREFKAYREKLVAEEIQSKKAEASNVAEEEKPETENTLEKSESPEDNPDSTENNKEGEQ